MSERQNPLARNHHLVVWPSSHTTINKNLTWGRLFSRLREMAPEPHPTSKHVRWESPAIPGFFIKSVSTSSTSSCTNVQRKQCCGYDFTKYYALCVCACFFLCWTSVSGLGMNTGGLIFSVRSLKSHSSITYCTGILHQTQSLMSIVNKKTSECIFIQ